MKLIVYKNVPCPILLVKESDTFLILFKDEQKWIFESSIDYGEIFFSKKGISYKVNNIPHRENGPAKIKPSGHKEWYRNGKLHREDGPACEYVSGTKSYYKHGKLHRLDGPAIQHYCLIKNKIKNSQWFIDGKQYSSKEYSKKIEEMKRDGTYNL